MNFNPELTLGNVLQIFTMLLGATAIWSQLRTEIALIKQAMKYIVDDVEALKEIVRNTPPKKSHEDKI